MPLDPTDIRILNELQKDSSMSNVELAKRVRLSPSPCLMRVKSLRDRGIIRNYVALADPKLLGLDLNVFISISLKEQSKAALAEFEKCISEHDEVMECYLMTGDSDYLIRVAISDIGALEKFILEQLRVLHSNKFVIKPHSPFLNKKATDLHIFYFFLKLTERLNYPSPE